MLLFAVIREILEDKTKVTYKLCEDTWGIYGIILKRIIIYEFLHSMVSNTGFSLFWFII